MSQAYVVGEKSGPLINKISSRLAWILSTASVLLVIAAFGIAVSTAVTSGDYRTILSHQALTPFVTIVYALIGALVASRHPRNPIGWIFVSVGCLYALGALAAAFRDFGTPFFPVGELAVWFGNWLWIPGVLLPTTFVLLVFPDGHLPSPRWRLVAWSAALGLSISMLVVMFHPGPLPSWGVVSNPYGIPAVAQLLDILVNISTAALFVGLVGSLAGFSIRFRRSTGIEREQMKWLAYAGGMMVLGFALSSAVWFFWPDIPLLGELSISLTNLTILSIAVAAAIAILQYRLYDIDLIINRTLVYGALTAGVTIIYGVVVGVTGIALQTSSNLAALLVTTILAALVLRPLHAQVQRGVDHLMFGASPPSQNKLSPPWNVNNRLGAPNKSITESRPVHFDLTGRWLNVARVLWVLLIILAVTLWIVGTIEHSFRIPVACPENMCDPFALSGSDLLVLADLDLPVGFISGFFVASNIWIALAFFTTAGFIAWRKSSDWMGLLVSFTLVYLGTAFFTDSDDALWRVYDSSHAPLTLLGMFGYAAFMLALFYFPDGQFVPRWRYARVASGLIILLTTPFVGTVTRMGSPGVFPFLATIGLGLAAQVYRYRRISNEVQRQQTKWVVLGLASSLAVMLAWIFAAVTLPPGSPSEQRVYFLLFARPLISLLIPLFPLTIAFSILRHRLWDVDVVINRTLVFGMLTVAILLLYGLVVGVLGALFQASGNLLISLLATGLAAILFQPLRERLQRIVNRLMYGERDDPYAVLSRLGRRLESSLSPEATLSTVVETVAQALKLPYVAIALKQDEDFKIAASYGLAEDEVVQLPLIYQGETVGRLILAARSPNETFTPAEQRLLEDITHHIGIAAHSVHLTHELRQLAAELQRSRERLITAQEEERRRLRRDLHDGLGPVLASQGLKLAVLLQLVERDPKVASTLINELITQNEGVVVEIRRLVYDLRPPALDELGLVDAVRDQVILIGEDAGMHQDLQIRVEEPLGGLPPLPAAVEVAAYRIALEAVTNVARHSHADSCKVRFSVDGALSASILCLEICDDGTGLPDGFRAGVGLTSMRERAEEVGGECVVESLQEGGTRVMARLPIFQ